MKNENEKRPNNNDCLQQLLVRLQASESDLQASETAFIRAYAALKQNFESLHSRLAALENANTEFKTQASLKGHEARLQRIEMALQSQQHSDAQLSMSLKRLSDYLSKVR